MAINTRVIFRNITVGIDRYHDSILHRLICKNNSGKLRQNSFCSHCNVQCTVSLLKSAGAQGVIFQLVQQSAVSLANTLQVDSR